MNPEAIQQENSLDNLPLIRQIQRKVCSPHRYIKYIDLVLSM